MLPRIAALVTLFALALPAAASADRLVDPGSPVFKSVDRETINTFGPDLVAFAGYVYFAANDNLNGNELWRTNGTSTELVANINPGASGASSNPHSFYIAGSRLYFNANPGDSTAGVFYIDASAPTTVQRAKAQRVTSGTENASATLVGVVNDIAILSRLQGETGNSNYAVYALGDTGDTFQKISTGNDDINANNVFTASATVGGWMYYTRSNTNVSPGVGAEPWRTDGETTELVKDIYPNDAPTSYPGSNPGSWVATSDRVYFLADDGVHGRELWVSNPADKDDTHIVHEHHAGLSPATYFDDPGAVANGNILYYTPNDPDTGNEVWRTDGTDAGTRVVQDITPGTGAQSGPDPFPFKAGVGMLRGSDIYYSDGTDAGTIKVGEAAGDGIGPNTPVVRGEQAYFVAGFSPFGQAVWRTDGTPGGTNAITAGAFDTAANGCTCAQSLAVLGDKVIFFGRVNPNEGDVKVFYLDTTQPDDTRQATTPTTITGTPAVGQTLTANKGAWTRDSNNKYEYAWLRNGEPIGTPLGIFQTTYTVRPEDAGQQIVARITAIGIGAPNVVVSDSAPVVPTGPVASPSPSPSASPAPSATPLAALRVRKQPKLRGKAKVGKKLKLRLPKLAQSGVKLSFRWYANGKRIKKQSKSSLKLSKKLKGKRITAKIKVKKAGYKTLTLKVGPTKKVKRK